MDEVLLVTRLEGRLCLTAHLTDRGVSPASRGLGRDPPSASWRVIQSNGHAAGRTELG